MHLPHLIRDLAVILGVAGLVTLIFQRIRQPVVLGYIIAGVIVGPHVLPRPLVTDTPNIRVWAELGVIFLMFSLGLEFSFRKLSRVGVSSAMTALFEVGLMFALGTLAGRAMGWGPTDSLFLGAMISISSTTIIIKALDELRLKTRRFSEMIFGVLVVEDLLAVLLIVGLSMLAASQSFSGMHLALSAGKLVLVIGTWFLVGYFLVPRFVRFVGRHGNEEMLTILSVALCLTLVVLAAYFHYSTALGAFIMGSILAESTESVRIEELIRPLRDLFAAVFFVSVGMLLDPAVLLQQWSAVLIVTVVLIVGKIVNITLGSLVTGQTLRTSIQVGFGMAQIGEFSFIIATLGQTLGVTSSHLYPVAVAVSVLSTFTTPYFIKVSHKVAVRVESWLPHRAKHMMSQYAAWMLERRAHTAHRAAFYRTSFKWALNGIVVTAIFTTLSYFAPSYLEVWISGDVRHFAALVIAVVASAPFVWAMFFSFIRSEFANDHFTVFVSRFLTLGWVGLLTLEFLAPGATLFFTASVLLIFMVVFRKQLSHSYQWFEHRFMSTFEPTQKSKRTTDVFRHLAPWDAHLVRIKVHPNSEVAGHALKDANLRGKFGINIVVIQRGLKTIVAPHPEEMILPKDELLVLGTDEQIDPARMHIEKPPGLAERFATLSGYQMKQVLVGSDSPLVGRTIRESGIREKCGGMVVGIERGDARMVNPSSDLKIDANDVLWVVGDTEKLEMLGELVEGSVGLA